MEHVDNTVGQVCSGNTLEWFPIVFNKTFVNYEAMCQMIIKILILNVNIAGQKLKFKNRQHTLKNTKLILKMIKGQNISCQIPFKYKD
jgi:hypothetical protein